MERLQKEKNGMPVWINKGSGSFRLNTAASKAAGKRIIKPNEKFRAPESDIPQAFRDIIVPGNEVSQKIIEKKEEPEKEVKIEFQIKPRGTSAGWFDVIQLSNGKVMNEKALRPEQAEEFKNSLEK